MDAVAALNAVQERLRERDALTHIPTNVLADLDQIMAEYPYMQNAGYTEEQYGYLLRRLSILDRKWNDIKNLVAERVADTRSRGYELAEDSFTMRVESILDA
jgi:hypothetical protein